MLILIKVHHFFHIFLEGAFQCFCDGPSSSILTLAEEFPQKSQLSLELSEEEFLAKDSGEKNVFSRLLNQ